VVPALVRVPVVPAWVAVVPAMVRVPVVLAAWDPVVPATVTDSRDTSGGAAADTRHSSN